MYHISKDKRAARSAALIYDGLLECMKKKPFDAVTISDLQKASGVARTTFYRAFDNLSDVLYWKCDTCFSEALAADENQPPGYYLCLPYEKRRTIAAALWRTSRNRYKAWELFYRHPHWFYHQRINRLAEWRTERECGGIGRNYQGSALHADQRLIPQVTPAGYL